MQGKSDDYRQFCLPSLTDDEWKREGIMTLTQVRKVCPAYFVPSTLDKKRGICVPNYALEDPGSEKAKAISTILKRIQVSSIQMLSPRGLLEGTQYVLDKAVEETFWEKTWREHLDKIIERKTFTDRFSDLTGYHV